MIRMKIEEFERQAKLLKILEKLHELGLTYGEAEKFPFALPELWSGYSMGEEIIWKFNDETLFVEDYKKQYAKHCKWTPKHGSIVMRFTSKKQLKKFAQKAILFRLTAEDVEKVIDKSKSTLKNGNYTCNFKDKIANDNYSIKLYD